MDSAERYACEPHVYFWRGCDTEDSSGWTRRDERGGAKYFAQGNHDGAQRNGARAEYFVGSDTVSVYNTADGDRAFDVHECFKRARAG